MELSEFGPVSDMSTWAKETAQKIRAAGFEQAPVPAVPSDVVSLEVILQQAIYVYCDEMTAALTAWNKYKDGVLSAEDVSALVDNALDALGMFKLK